MEVGPNERGAEPTLTQETSKTTPTESLSDPLTSQALAAIEDEAELNKLLDKAVNFEERQMIRAALRELLRRKREKREQERVPRLQGLSKAGTAGMGLNRGEGTIHRQFSEPKTGASVRKPSVASAPHSPAPVTPNTKSVKQMLLDWCRIKTEPYEGINIKNFSSSWSDGIAFCALVHRFFPDAFEYSILNPTKRRENFELAFNTAERLADCPPLLDVDDLLRMDEPDWKCVYTYIQEFYRCLVEKGLVKTKKRP
ncbi:smoothelin-like protein 1 isoform X1 [Osmerus mordax]|uniref:smoothelin-like protein 1 isoform X1 n=2 Tax=Osmerus mordax TaxID=8014 RepID=UPI00350E9C73